MWGALEGYRRRVGIEPQATSLPWQEASRCLSKSKELMEAVLRDPGLMSLQREGGATLARLRQEGSRLNFNPDVRYRHQAFPPQPHYVPWVGTQSWGHFAEGSHRVGSEDVQNGVFAVPIFQAEACTSASPFSVVFLSPGIGGQAPPASGHHHRPSTISDLNPGMSAFKSLSLIPHKIT